ncbi:MAG: hypothetical protein RML94_08815 [Bacteroidia bacterium]|nr:hypothetical protein [Bacteroidia bacterium]
MGVSLLTFRYLMQARIRQKKHIFYKTILRFYIFPSLRISKNKV